MTRRRGRGEGSIRERADGRWEVRVDIGRGLDGKRRRKSAFAKTQAEAVRLLRKLGGRAADGQLTVTSTPTVARYLEDWFTTNSDSWRPSTRRGYRGAIDLHLVPAFGSVRLEQLTPSTIQRWLTNQKAEHGARRRISLAHATLRSALSEAQRLQLVTLNAATLVKVPKGTARTIASLNVEQAKAFRTAAEKHRLGPLFSVALACGLRLGEATGLRWDDVNLETGEVQIRQQLQRVGRKLVTQELKTDKSRRTLVLPQFCIQALKDHRKQQLQERLKAGKDWTDSGLVFTTYAPRGDERKRGGGLHPRNVLRALAAIVKAANTDSDGEPAKVQIPRMRFHDLRHSAASLLIAAGVELSEVSMLLGHSELRVTMDFYAHLQKQTAAKAARRMDSVLKNAQGVS